MSLDSSRPAPSRRVLRIVGVVAALVAIAVVVTGVLARSRNAAELRDWTREQAVPTVAVVEPDAQTQGGVLELPGRLEAYARAPLYARVSGYLANWKADIGTPVKAGQVLAEIQTPELDQQLAQARADLASAQANADLAQATAQRWQAMSATGAVSKQNVDEKLGDATTKKALVRSAQANVERMQAMKGFARIVAPFDGVVTARNTDVGALVNAGGNPGQELFVVSDISRLRAYVSVPQTSVPQIAPGTAATITVPERPGTSYAATVESSAQAVDAASGSTLMQLAVDNAGGELLPGAFARVRFALPVPANTFGVPSSALIFGSAGVRIAVVRADDTIELRTVSIARDLGKTVELDSGVGAQDRVVESPPDGLADGDRVRVAKPAAAVPHG